MHETTVLFDQAAYAHEHMLMSIFLMGVNPTGMCVKQMWSIVWVIAQSKGTAVSNAQVDCMDMRDGLESIGLLLRKYLGMETERLQTHPQTHPQIPIMPMTCGLSYTRSRSCGGLAASVRLRRRHEVYLLYWYKSTNTDTEGAPCQGMPRCWNTDFPVDRQEADCVWLWTVVRPLTSVLLSQVSVFVLLY